MKVNFIYTNIGRGHPFYLDGLLDCIKEKHADCIEPEVNDVFNLSDGFALKLWKLSRTLYRTGSQGGLMHRVYELIRSLQSNTPGTLDKIMGGHLIQYVKNHPHNTIVAHPILVKILSGAGKVYYQHGELVAPSPALVDGASVVFVPTKECAEKFIDVGYNASDIFISGICIENGLVRQARSYYENRLYRFENNKFLIGAVYSSGAEPKPHIDKIISSVTSLEREGHKAIIFCRAGGRLETALSRLNAVVRYDPEVKTASFEEFSRSNSLAVIVYRDRIHEAKLTEKMFKYFDFLIAPSHERSNWAIGLGLPVYILLPTIGPFSPLNREVILGHNVGCDIPDNTSAENMGRTITNDRSNGKLAEMANNGFGSYEINGFAKIAEYLSSSLT